MNLSLADSCLLLESAWLNCGLRRPIPRLDRRWLCSALRLHGGLALRVDDGGTVRVVVAGFCDVAESERLRVRRVAPECPVRGHPGYVPLS